MAVHRLSLVAEHGLLVFTVRGLLIAVASLVAEHGLWAREHSSRSSQALERRLSSCGAWAVALQSVGSSWHAAR